MADPDLLRDRIENLYQQVTGSPTPHGAQTWFARKANVDNRTVNRWFRGEREPQGPVLALLDALEKQAGIS